MLDAHKCCVYSATFGYKDAGAIKLKPVQSAIAQICAAIRIDEKTDSKRTKDAKDKV